MLTDQENAAASLLASHSFVWKKYQQQYRQIVHRCRAMEKNRPMYESMQASARRSE